ncbi:hypothetical protein FA95DRAFT_382304 [Auriscalpium vulgare]|uniref:Uncharacterized protein n=1 Tax=Auriscalpium vulgare TaxID=40419 RepID=A0ACB8S5B4_9AGAM|nr:hypothetical protein FA95DRAFT_382304 [Auriscalpium vulgare]
MTEGHPIGKRRGRPKRSPSRSKAVVLPRPALHAALSFHRPPSPPFTSPVLPTVPPCPVQPRKLFCHVQPSRVSHSTAPPTLHRSPHPPAPHHPRLPDINLRAHSPPTPRRRVLCSRRKARSACLRRLPTHQPLFPRISAPTFKRRHTAAQSPITPLSPRSQSSHWHRLATSVDQFSIMEFLKKPSTPTTHRYLSKSKPSSTGSSLPITIPSMPGRPGASPARRRDPSPDLLFDFSPPGEGDIPAPQYFRFAVAPSGPKTRLGLVDTSVHVRPRTPSPRASDRFMYAFPMPSSNPKSRGGQSETRFRGFAAPISPLSRSPSPPFGGAAPAPHPRLSVRTSEDRGVRAAAYGADTLPSPSPSPPPSVTMSPTPPMSSYPISPPSESEFMPLPHRNGQASVHAPPHSFVGKGNVKLSSQNLERGRGRAPKPRPQ